MKTQAKDWEKISAKHLISRLKNSYNSLIKDNPVTNRAKDFNTPQKINNIQAHKKMLNIFHH